MEAFSLAEEHPPMAGLTISSKINLQTSVNNVTCFSLGKGTSIRKVESATCPREKY